MRVWTILTLLAVTASGGAAFAETETSTSAGGVPETPPPAPEPAPVVPEAAEPAPKAAPPSKVEATAPAPAPSSEDDRRYYVAGRAQLRMLAVMDETPANDLGMIWNVESGYQVIPTGVAFMRAGVLQRFVDYDSYPAIRLQDTLIGFKLFQELDPKSVGLETKSLDLEHRLQFYLPTSIASQRQDLYLAPEYVGKATLGVTEELTFELQLRGQYRFHRYAERQGPGAGLNTQLVLGASLNAEYAAFEHERYGNVVVGIDGGTSSVKRYPSRESFESETSDQAPWFQSYSWDVYASYVPIAQLAFTLSLEQGGPVLRDGVVNTFFFKREETQLVFTVDAKY
jgi:hypothetical protein